MRIEDYGIIGDTQSVAMVGRNGSIDWLSLPRFDSASVFAALVGHEENGHWAIAPAHEPFEVTRRYRADSLVLETDYRTERGVVRVTDAMPIRDRYPVVVRVVTGIEGSVRVRSELRIRFEYGRVKPWLRAIEGGLQAVAGPSSLVLRTTAPLEERSSAVVSDFTLHEGERVSFALTWHPSHERPPESPDAARAIDDTEAWWRDWVSHCRYAGKHCDAVVRSLITLKALTYGPTGGIVAAPTTSLPEAIGHARNWDYRYCWLRDATFTLNALLHAGYTEEACAWRDWVTRAVAGDPEDLQIMYGPAGEREIPERTLDWLCGYERSRPVRARNAAAGQLQLDVYGEVLNALHEARRMNIAPDPASWSIQRALAEWLEDNWSRPDEGIWEIRGQRAQHTHSKVMAWVAMDRAARAVSEHGMTGPAHRWRRVRDAIKDDVLANGFHAEIGSFTQSYGSDVIDASLLLIPAVGFLPPDDPRVRGTIAAVERMLLSDGFVFRYPTSPAENIDGLRGREGAFIACSCWLVDAYALAGRRDDAERAFERVLSVANDLGLLSEEYDTERRRLVGNFPQAFSHVAVVKSAMGLATSG